MIKNRLGLDEFIKKETIKESILSKEHNELIYIPNKDHLINKFLQTYEARRLSLFVNDSNKTPNLIIIKDAFTWLKENPFIDNQEAKQIDKIEKDYNKSNLLFLGISFIAQIVFANTMIFFKNLDKKKTLSIGIPLNLTFASGLYYYYYYYYSKNNFNSYMRKNPEIYDLFKTKTIV